MNEKLQRFLKAQEEAKQKNYDANKRQILCKLKLVDQIYSPVDQYTTEFPLSVWDAKEQKYRYYKEEPIQITDEEFEEVRKYYNPKKHDCLDTESDDNGIATALTVIAWIIFICGFILGIILGADVAETSRYFSDSSSEFSISTALITWAVSFISGIAFLGFAEIIKLLHDINNKIK